MHLLYSLLGELQSDMSGQKTSVQDQKSGGEVAEHSKARRIPPKRHAKSDVRYWEGKIFHEAYTRDGDRVQMQDWSVRIQHGGRRETFALGTPNKAAASAMAKEIFFALKGGNWEEALQRFKPSSAAPVKAVATVGNLLRDVQGMVGLRPKTLNDYAKALRKIVADIFEIDGGRGKFNPHTGGWQKWVAQVDAVKLADITPEKVQRWKLGFLKQAGDDPVKQRRAKISVNSLIRQAKSLFSKKATLFLTIQLPTPLPFDGVAFEPRQTMRYHSTIDVPTLIKKAEEELANGVGEQQEQYKVFLLGLCAGLRRNEIDKLEWSAFDFQNHFIRIQNTEFLHLKTEESCGEVEIDAEVAAIFSSMRDTTTGRFVVASDRVPILNAKYSTYRCMKIFEGLTDWLRKQGVTAQKPLHELRKEFGATLTNAHGIYAASRALRHSDIAITTQHYADKTRRATTGFGKMLGSSKIALPSNPPLEARDSTRNTSAKNEKI